MATKRKPDKSKKTLVSADEVSEDSSCGPIDDLIPEPAYMAPMWAAGLSWALREDSIVDAFRKDTGATWKPGRTPIEAMVDSATGADLAFIRAFIVWFNANIWGDPLGGDGEVA